MNEKDLIEEVYAEYFVKWLNKEYSFSFKAVKNKKKDSAVDCYMVCDSSNERIGLQLTATEDIANDIRKNSDDERVKILEKRKDVKSIYVGGNLDRTIFNAINSHKYDPEEEKKVILIIQASKLMPPEKKCIEKYINQYNDKLFRGIYYVCVSEEMRNKLGYKIEGPEEHERDGYVVSIKNARW